MTEIVFAALFGLFIGQDVTLCNVIGMGLMMGSLALMERKADGGGSAPAGRNIRRPPSRPEL